MSIRSIRFALLSVVVLLACARAAAIAPVTIEYGVDACAFCHMQIENPSRAAQFVTNNGTHQVFDEPGCLVQWLKQHPEAGGIAFVADAETQRWLPAGSLFYVRAVVEGMFDVRAGYARRAAADSIARVTGGTVQDWRTLLVEGVRGANQH